MKQCTAVKIVVIFALAILSSGVQSVQAIPEADQMLDMPTGMDHHHAEVHEDPSPEPFRELPATTISPPPASGSRVTSATASSIIGPSFYQRPVHYFDVPGTQWQLYCGGSGNSRTRLINQTWNCEGYNWANGARATLKLPQDWFCGAGVFMPSGTLLFAGGTEKYPSDNSKQWRGANGTYTMKYVGGKSPFKITRLGDMHEKRWYNNIVFNNYSNTTITWGGESDGKFSDIWEYMPYGQTQWQLYPWNQFQTNYEHYTVLDADHLAYTGVSTSDGVHQPHILDLRNGTTIDTPGLRDANLRNAGSAIALYPAQSKRFMVMGGGESKPAVQATNKVDMIDYSAAITQTPSFTPLPNMPAQVVFVQAATLPNGQVFVTGGTREWRTGSVKWAGIYTPWTKKWTVLPAAKVPRNYHSGIHTLVNGKVVVLSGNPANGTFEPRSEVFSPWYVRVSRPKISQSALNLPSLRFGQSMKILTTFPKGVTFGEVTLQTPRAVTHSTSDANYALYKLPATRVSGGVSVRVPTDMSIPPGMYKLSVVSADHRPSGQKWVRIVK